MPGLGEHFLSLGDYFVNVATDDKYNLNPNRKITLEEPPKCIYISESSS